MAGEQGQKIAFLKDALNALATAVNKVSAGLIDLDKIISKVTGKTREFAKEQQNAAQTMNRVGKNLQQTAKDVDNYGKKTEKAGKSQKGFFGGMAKNLKTIVSFYGAYQILNVTLSALQDITIGSAKRAIALEKALADLKAVAGLTSNDVSRLKDVVFDVAGVTSLTATEVVSLQKELAKLGSSVDEIEQLTRPVALLSQALGEEPGGVAATLKKTLNQFQETSEEANRFANILTGAVNETALSMSDLGTALAYVGPLGAQLGVSFEDTAALLGILADNGFKASKAGTGLRQFFITAAKDGRPFNEFLEDIASKNLNVNEATELFNKTGASQALVISENLERFKELSKELEKSDRLFKANATQMASTQGQLDLLKSAYDKFSTSLGGVITQTDLFLSLIAIFDREAAGQASAYRTIANATEDTQKSIDLLTNSQKQYNKTQSETLTDLQMIGAAFDALGGTVDINRVDFLYEFNEELKKTGNIQDALANLGKTWNSELNEAALTIRELINITYEQSRSLDDAYIAQEANNESVKRYKREYSGLLSLTREGINVDKEKAELTKQIDSEIESLQKASFKAASDRDFEQQNIIVKRIALLKEQKEKINELSVSEETLAQKRKRQEKERKERENALKAEIDLIKDRTKADIDAINERAKIETAIAQRQGNIEEVARIELNRQKEVSAAYAKESSDILNLISNFKDFKDAIQEAAKDSKELSGVLTSDLFKDAEDALKNYEDAVKDLKKQREDGLITEQKYNAEIAILNDSLLSVFENMRLLFGTSPELEQYFKLLIQGFKDTAKYTEDIKEEENPFEKWVESMREDRGWIKYLKDAIAESEDVLGDFNDVALENTKNRLDAEIDAIKNRYEIEEDILKSQLDNQLITESQYRAKQRELRKAQLAEENSIEKKIFDAETKQQRNDVIIETSAGIAEALADAILQYGWPQGLIPGGIASSIVATSGAAKLAAVNQRKFFPKKFADGGVVNGPSHADGGVPFTVQGQAGYEMEGGEFIVNKRATSMHRDLLERINNSYRTNPQVGRMKFADGGLVPSPVGQSVDYLKAIAEATTSTAMNTNKPVRAYVADKDLRTNATERRLRDRNDRI